MTLVCLHDARSERATSREVRHGSPWFSSAPLESDETLVTTLGLHHVDLDVGSAEYEALNGWSLDGEANARAQGSRAWARYRSAGSQHVLKAELERNTSTVFSCRGDLEFDTATTHAAARAAISPVSIVAIVPGEGDDLPSDDSIVTYLWAQPDYELMADLTVVRRARSPH